VRAFEATTTIDAPPERVWRILTDGAAYPTWDSGVTRVEGRIADGEQITVHAEVSPGRAFPVRVAMEPPDAMTWTGGMPLGLFTGTRTFRTAPNGGGTSLTMREAYTGPLAGLMFRQIPDLSPSFERFVNGVKHRAEAG
jgi:uncharacterized protein YndB with AHSA1/START domain